MKDKPWSCSNPQLPYERAGITRGRISFGGKRALQAETTAKRPALSADGGY